MKLATVVKSSFIRSGPEARGRAKAHARYISYRPGADGETEQRLFFSADQDGLSAKSVQHEIEQRKGHGVLVHKMILSPGLNGIDLQDYTKHLMAEWGAAKGLDLTWRAVIHNNTRHEHVHLLLFGKDKNNRNVHISRKDLNEMRSIGDRYIESEHELEAQLSQLSKRTSSKLTAKISNFLNSLKLGASKYKEINTEKKRLEQIALQSFFKRREFERAELAKLESAAFGEQPDEFAIAFKKIARWQRQYEQEQKQQKELSRPIQIDYGKVQVTYTQNSAKPELVLLKNQYERGHFTDQIDKKASRRLDRWISNWERWERETKRLDWIAKKDARKIRSIEVEILSGQKRRLSLDSDFQDLKQLQELHDRAKVHLNPAEYKALSDWIKYKERSQPIVLDMGKNAEPLVYRKDDPQESLQLLANVARNALDEQQYKRLYWWIQEMERNTEKTAAQSPTADKPPQHPNNLFKSKNKKLKVVKKDLPEL